jgi:membrane protease YdiL (CAAX protease family)
MLRPGAAIALWGGLCLCAAFYGRLSGHGSREFGTTLVAMAILFAGEVWLAAPAIIAALTRASGPQGGVLVALWPLIAYLIYALGALGAVGTGSFAWWRFGIAAAYTLVPVVLAASAHGAKPGAWQDYSAMLAIYGGYGWLRYVFPFPAHSFFPLLFAINVALVVFVLVRRMEGIGYSIGWPVIWIGYALLSFAAIAAIDVPLGIAIHFVKFDPSHAHWRTLPLALLGILAFTAWPEEFLFRGLLQNLLGKTLRSENAGWIAASVLFGLSHILHGRFPNWRYVLLATVAGLFYGFTWRKTRSIFPAAIVHTLVDSIWFLLFRTL